MDIVLERLQLFGLSAFIDVGIVAFFLYLLLILLKRTRSQSILGGILFLLLLYVGSSFAGLKLTALILKYFFTFVFIILVVVFQRELRNFFELVFVFGIFARQKAKSASESTREEIVEALQYLAGRKIGALIVIAGIESVDDHLEGGFELGGHVSRPLLLSIFDPSSPGHDGAVVIEGDLVSRFGAHLPLAERFNFKNMGTRHRAALGLSEQTDALVLVVSEERGTISVAQHGRLVVLDDVAATEKVLGTFAREEEKEIKKRSYRWLTQNIQEKTLAFVVSLLLWLTFVR